MSTLKIVLSHKNKEIGTSDYITVDNVDQEKSSIYLKNFKLSKVTQLEKEDVITISIWYNLKYKNEFITSLKDSTTFDSDDDLNFVCAPLPEDYEQKLIDILWSWSNNIHLEWQTLNSKEKNIWITACLYHSGVPSFFKKDTNFVIDGELITDESDFYCLLGETFFGYRGYFGRGLDSFADCLVEMKTGNKTGSKVLLKSIHQIKKALNSYYHDEFERIVATFQKFGFDVEAINN